MIVYNVTVNVDDSIHDEWVEWMSKEHMPKVLETGCFKESNIYRIVSPEPDENEGQTYCIQYYAKTIDDYERYQLEYAAFLQSEHTEKYEGRFTAFRTVMESV